MFRALVVCLSVVLRAYASPEDLFLHLVCQVESSGGHPSQLVGDGGKSWGIMQMKKEAWEDVNTYRRSKHLKIYSYTQYRMVSSINFEYARTYLMTVQKKRLTDSLGRSPTFLELYASYNLGFASFKRKGFSLKKVPQSTRRNCRWIEAQFQEAGHSIKS